MVRGAGPSELQVRFWCTNDMWCDHEIASSTPESMFEPKGRGKEMILGKVMYVDASGDSSGAVYGSHPETGNDRNTLTDTI